MIGIDIQRNALWFKFLKWLYPSVNKRVFQPTYFDATNAMMDRMEKEDKDNLKLLLCHTENCDP